VKTEQLTLKKIRPTEKQKSAWKYLLDFVTVLLVFGGGAGGGKSWLGCEWLLVMCLRYPGTRYFIGRNELKQIRSTTLETFYKVLRFYGIVPDSILRYNAQDHIILFHNGSRIDLLDLQYLPSDPFFERWGSYEFSSGWVEEASEVDEGAIDTLKSRIGRCLNDKYKIFAKILITCNPKKVWIYYNIYKPWKDGTLAKDKAFVQSLVDDNPFNESQYKEKLQGITDLIKRERLLFGNWDYSEEAGQVIAYQDIIDAIDERTSPRIPKGQKYITADIARFGSDNTVIVLWSGLRAEEIHVHPHLSILQSCEKIKDLASKNKVSIQNIIVDEDGIGGGVVDGLGCKGFLNGSKPIPGKKGDDNFANLKTQAYYRLGEFFKEKKIFINCRQNTELRNQLIEEMEQVRLKDSDTENKIAIVSKKDIKQRIGRSPDISDAIMMRVFFELKPTSQPRMSFHKMNRFRFNGDSKENGSNVVQINRNGYPSRDNGYISPME